MNVRVLYTPNTPADGNIAELQRRLGQQGIELELVNADSRPGIALGELYDLVGRPAVVVTDSDGRLIEQWQHELPRPDDVAAVFVAS